MTWVSTRQFSRGVQLRPASYETEPVRRRPPRGGGRAVGSARRTAIPGSKPAVAAPRVREMNGLEGWPKMASGITLRAADGATRIVTVAHRTAIPTGREPLRAGRARHIPQRGKRLGGAQSEGEKAAGPGRRCRLAALCQPGCQHQSAVEMSNSKAAAERGHSREGEQESQNLRG